MLEDCKFGHNPDLSEHISRAINTLKENDFEAQLTEEDKKLLSIIHPGFNKDIDQLINALQ